LKATVCSKAAAACLQT